MAAGETFNPFAKEIDGISVGWSAKGKYMGLYYKFYVAEVRERDDENQKNQCHRLDYPTNNEPTEWIRLEVHGTKAKGYNESKWFDLDEKWNWCKEVVMPKESGLHEATICVGIKVECVYLGNKKGNYKNATITSISEDKTSFCVEWEDGTADNKEDHVWGHVRALVEAAPTTEN